MALFLCIVRACVCFCLFLAPIYNECDDSFFSNVYMIVYVWHPMNLFFTQLLCVHGIFEWAFFNSKQYGNEFKIKLKNNKNWSNKKKMNKFLDEKKVQTQFWLEKLRFWIWILLLLSIFLENLIYLSFETKFWQIFFWNKISADFLLKQNLDRFSSKTKFW